MEWFSTETLSALLTIIMIDLVLAGDNAMVIGMAARSLPKAQQKRVIVIGTAGAVVIRVIATLVVVYLLRIPGLLFAGGLLLIWIAYKLLTENKDHGNMKAQSSLWPAIRTIVVADAVMGIDNVIAIAGASHDNIVLVTVGLLISVPIVVWGSSLIIKWMEKWPWLLYVGAGVLAYTAAKMLVGEPLVADFFEQYAFMKWLVTAAVIAGVIVAGRRQKTRRLDVGSEMN